MGSEERNPQDAVPRLQSELLDWKAWILLFCQQEEAVFRAELENVC